MTLLSVAASLLSGVVAAAGWMGHQIRTLSVAPRAWKCLECGVPNELDRDTCWSCGEGYGEDPLYPSHIPFERRWLCPECAVWNGIARTQCWRCGAGHPASSGPEGQNSGPIVPVNPIAKAPGSSISQTTPLRRDGANSRRRNT